jgi:hypothetical protein
MGATVPDGRRCRYAELAAVFGNGPARYGKPFLYQKIADLLIGERMRFVFPSISRRMSVWT